MRTGTDKYDDSKSGGYSYADKLEMVAKEWMAPEEIGLTSHDEARQEIAGVEKEPQQPKLGDFVTFEASIVPPSLLAHWAYQEQKLKLPLKDQREWEAKWCEEHSGEFQVQAILHTGTLMARSGQTYADPILGFCEQLHKAATLLEAKYNELKKTDPNPIITRDETKTDRPTTPN
jgi:hypothetical protein